MPDSRRRAARAQPEREGSTKPIHLGGAGDVYFPAGRAFRVGLGRQRAIEANHEMSQPGIGRIVMVGAALAAKQLCVHDPNLRTGCANWLSVCSIVGLIFLVHPRWGVFLVHPRWGVFLVHPRSGVFLVHPRWGVFLVHPRWGVFLVHPG